MVDRQQPRNRTAVNSYVRIVRDFARHFDRPPDELSKEHIRTARLLLQDAEETVPHRKSFYPRAPRRLPIILTREEAIRLIDSASNLFHRAMLITMFSTGMRSAELCNLKVEDIDSTRMLIRIREEQE